MTAISSEVYIRAEMPVPDYDNHEETELGHLLRWWRFTWGWSVQTQAEKCGVARQTLWDACLGVERGGRLVPASSRTLVRIIQMVRKESGYDLTLAEATELAKSFTEPGENKLYTEIAGAIRSIILQQKEGDVFDGLTNQQQ